MKKAILTVAVLLTFTACKKEQVTPCNSVETVFKTNLKGTFMKVGFKTQLFNSWSYTSSGQIITIDDTSVSEPYNSSYEVLNNAKIFLIETSEVIKVNFGDTMLWVNQNNDSLKFVKQ